MGKEPTMPKSSTYVKMTAKQRKEKERAEPLVLVGFGKFDLKDMWEKYYDTDEEHLLYEAPAKYPSRYRRVSICSLDEVIVFQKFTQWLAEQMGFTAVPSGE